MKIQIHWLWIPLTGITSAVFALWLQSRMGAPLDSTARDHPANPPPSAVATYAQAVARAAPSVVSILSSQTGTQHRRRVSGFPLHPYGRGSEPISRRRGTSLGSGILWNTDGMILTNRHIVQGARAIQIILADGRTFEARVVGTDEETDLALLQAEGSDLPGMRIGHPRALRVGDVVLAIGNAYGMGQTVTMGIVSATGRSQLGITKREDFIQTDASINPGNSGGALVNTAGEVVGINTAIFSQSGGSEGIGFAIPIDLAIRVAKVILARGQVVRGWIGIDGRTVTPDLAERFGLRNAPGVLVDHTERGSPAQRSGLRPGDVIARIDDRRVASHRELSRIVELAGVDVPLRFEVWRGRERFSIQVTTRAVPTTPSP